jgi:glutamate-1-semialdehyde 2,1-aminomutase
MTAGLLTLRGLVEPGVFEAMVARTTKLVEGMQTAAKRVGMPLYTTQAGTMFCFFFNEGPVVDWETASSSNLKQFAAFFHAMLDRGVYFPPSQYESWFFSTAHTDEIVEATVTAATEAFGVVA